MILSPRCLGDRAVPENSGNPHPEKGTGHSKTCGKAGSGVVGSHRSPRSYSLTTAGWLASVLPADYGVIGWCQVVEKP